MIPDDDVARAMRRFAADVEGRVTAPPAREVLRRAGVTSLAPGTTRPTKQFPLAGIIAFAAAPFVAVGAVLVSPAGAGIFNGDGEAPATAPLDTVSTSPSAPAAPVTPSGASTTSGGQALDPLVDVTVAFSDDRVAPDADGCRRTTTRTRLVPEGNTVQAAVDGLLAGPLPEERVAGLASPLALPARTDEVAGWVAGSVAVGEELRTVAPAPPTDTATAADTAADTAAGSPSASDPASSGAAPATAASPSQPVEVVRVLRVTIADPAALPGTCGPIEFGRALQGTLSQFEGWEAALTVGGVEVALPAPAGSGSSALDGEPTDGSQPQPTGAE